MNINLYGKNANFLAQLDSINAASNLFETCNIDKKILNMADGELSIKCELPILDMHGFWTPDMFRPKMQLDWEIVFSCAAHRNFPYLSFFNQEQCNRGTIGITNNIDDSIVSVRMNQQTGNYDIEITISICEETERDDQV